MRKDNVRYTIKTATGIPILDEAGYFTSTNVEGALAELGAATVGDELVAIDSSATPGYLGAASNDGVLRTGSPISYTDGGNFVTLDIALNGINDTHIDWGTGENQVSAGDIPILDTGGYYTGTDVESALRETAGGTFFLPPVDDWYDPTGGLPVDPEVGDRYIASETGSGWTIDYIYEWDGDEWIEYSPIEGWMVWMLFELVFYVFFSGGWMEMGDGTYVRLDSENTNITNGTFDLTTTGNLYESGTFAEIYVDSGSTPQTIPTGATYTKSTAFTTNGQNSNCTADAANDKITITKTGKYRVEGSVSFSSDTANINIIGAVFLNGTEQSDIHFKRKIGAANDVGSAGFTGFIDVTSAPLDLDLRLRHDDAGDVDVTIEYANLNTQYLGET